MKSYARAIGLLALSWVLVACETTSGVESSDAPAGKSSGEATACLSGDRNVAAAAQCLQDDAACYPLADGSWCTGLRLSNCPMGSSPLPAELPCPANSRCFNQSESLQCVIGG